MTLLFMLFFLFELRILFMFCSVLVRLFFCIRDTKR